jgi:uncharacterized protein YjdB
MATYQVAYKASTKEAKIQPDGTAPGSGFTDIGSFDHDADLDDGLGIDAGHVYFQHVRDLLYAAGEQNMQAVTITIPAVTINVLPATVTLDISLGQTEDLATTPAPTTARTTLSYVSSDPTKATVSADGRITPVAAGATTVTVTATPGGATDTCVVTVIA